jgi:cobalamin biosynthesis Mg chelatase CobN
MRPAHPSRTLLVLLATAIAGLGLSPAAASADAGMKIVNQCFHQGKVSDDYSQQAYNEALRELPTDAVEYSECGQLIQQAQLAAASRRRNAKSAHVKKSGGGGHHTGGGPSTSSSSVPAAPTALTAAERAALAAASGRAGGEGVKVAGRVVHPTLGHVNVSSAVSTIPAPLLALLGMLAASALLAFGWLAFNRVRARGLH